MHIFRYSETEYFSSKQTQTQNIKINHFNADEMEKKYFADTIYIIEPFFVIFNVLLAFC